MNIIITGASRGIGAETAKSLASKYKVNMILIARDLDKLERLQKDIKQQYPQTTIYPYAFDLTAPTHLNKLLTSIHSKWDHLDILINNAALLKHTPLTDMELNELEDHFSVNLFSPFMLTVKLFNLLNKSQIKHIVNIGTMGAIQGSKKFSGLSAYSSSKASLANLTEMVAEEWKAYDIRANYLALGAVATEMFEEAFPDKKASVTPEEIADYIAEFALTGGQYFNGKILPVSKTTP